ncbi:MAG: TonB-dependent receptor [Deltaproteobacteria bacterium]|nr:TonB-dependent receptor [Deltaproteobacteria bacterium]
MMKMKMIRAGALLVLLLNAVPAGAEEAVQLEEVVVTATRTRVRREDATTSVTVISSDDIEQRGQVSAAEALRGAPGLDLTEFGSPGRSAFASLRGAAPDQVLVLLDGVAVNTPTVGQFDFADLPADNLERIEILRGGGGGALYGSQAVGGVINMVSRRGEGPLRLTLDGAGGSAATHYEVVSVSGARGPLAVSGTVSHRASDGFRSVNDDYRNLSTGWRADAEVLPAAAVRAFLRYTSTSAGLSQFNVAEQRLDADARSRADFLLAKGEWEQSLYDSLTYRAALSLVRHNLRYRDDEVDDDGEIEPVVIAHLPQQQLAAETQLDYHWREFALTTVGVSFSEQSARIFKQETEEEDGEIEQEIERFAANRSNAGAYAQQQLRLLDDTLLGTGGLRADHYDHFGDQLTFCGSAAYHLRATGTRLRAGYAEGFRAPTFDELFEPELGDPNLEAEESWEISAGLTQDLLDSRLRLEPTYFYREVSNFIEELADQLPGPIAGVPEGLGARNLNARFQGLELSAEARPWTWLTLSASYAYLNFAAQTGGLLNRPRHRGTVSARSTREHWFTAGDQAGATVQLYAVGRRASADPAQGFAASEIGGYARADLSLSYRFAGSLAPLTVHASVRNLLNRDYAESIAFPAPPAHFLIGVRYKL